MPTVTELELDRIISKLTEIIADHDEVWRRDNDPLAADIRDHCGCALRDAQKALGKAQARRTIPLEKRTR